MDMARLLCNLVHSFRPECEASAPETPDPCLSMGYRRSPNQKTC
jgi:hypothetical protein